jgi:hypothetical protein
MSNLKKPAAVALGRLGGKAKVPKGISMLSSEERSIRAKEAAAKRWSSQRKKLPVTK